MNLAELLDTLPTIEFDVLELHGPSEGLLLDSPCVSRRDFAQRADADPAFSPDPEQESFARSVMTGVVSALAHVMQEHQVYDVPFSWEGFMWDALREGPATSYDGCMTRLLIEDLEEGSRRATGEVVLEPVGNHAVHVRFQADVRGHWRDEIVRMILAIHGSRLKTCLLTSSSAALFEATKGPLLNTGENPVRADPS